MTDGEIIILLNSRDEKAINALTERFGGLCRTLIANILSDRRDIEECLSSVFMRIWLSVPPARPENLTAYVAKTARNEALMRYRSNKTRRLNELVPFEELADCLPAAQDQAEARETVRAINDFLSALPEQKRRVFVRRYWFAESIAEIARRYGMSESGVKSMLFKLRKKLKKHLESEGIKV